MKIKSFFFLVVLLKLKFCQGTLEVDENCVDVHRGEFTSNHLYLMPKIDEAHEFLNTRFIESANILGFKVGIIKVHPNCTIEHFSALKITERLCKKYYKNTSIINLKVNIPSNFFDQYNEGSTKEVIAVGYTYEETIELEVFKCNITNKESCIFADERLNVSYTKLTSPLKYKILYEIIEHIDDADYLNNNIPQLKQKQIAIPRHSIIICANDFNDDLKHKFELIMIKECINVNEFTAHDVLAVIAPKPFENEEMTYLPVVFYDTPYLLPKHEIMYPNSITLYGDHFDNITQLIINTLQKQSWTRVAMVSDNSPKSDIFEEKMIKLFNQNSMTYNTQQCLGLNCNFTKALKSLHEVDARIIIANVDENYVIQLAHAATSTHLTANNNVLWIFRDCPLNSKSECNNLGKYQSLHGLGEVLCISTSPDASKRDHMLISKALSYVEKAFKKAPHTEDEMFKLNLRNRSSTLMEEIKILQEIPIVYDKKLIMNGSQCNSFRLEAIGTLDYLDSNTCNLKSYKFASLCEDSYPLIILLLILGVLLAVLIIIVFLKKCSPRLRKYSTFK